MFLRASHARSQGKDPLVTEFERHSKQTTAVEREQKWIVHAHMRGDGTTQDPACPSGWGHGGDSLVHNNFLDGSLPIKDGYAITR